MSILTKIFLSDSSLTSFFLLFNSLGWIFLDGFILLINSITFFFKISLSFSS